MKYPCVKASNLGHEWTTSVPFKTRQMLSFLEEIPSNDKKIEIITNVLNQLKELVAQLLHWVQVLLRLVHYLKI